MADGPSLGPLNDTLDVEEFRLFLVSLDREFDTQILKLKRTLAEVRGLNTNGEDEKIDSR